MEKRDNRIGKQKEINVVFGIHSVEEALRSGKVIEKLYITRSNQHAKEIIGKCEKLEIPIHYVPIEKIQQITQKNHQGVLAFISPIEYANLAELVIRTFETGKTPFFVMLDRITDVRNFGAISRTAESAGLHGIIIPSKGAAQIQEDAIKTSSGALHYIPVCREHNLKDTIQFLKSSGIRIVACTEKSNRYYFDADLKGPLCIVMGSEENGISHEYLKLCDDTIKIPMKGKVESLNVSVACGIVLYECIRQNTF